MLVSMGFDPQACRAALEQAGAAGGLERAIELLLGGNIDANNTASGGDTGVGIQLEQGQGQGQAHCGLAAVVLPVSQYTYIEPHQEGVYIRAFVQCVWDVRYVRG